MIYTLRFILGSWILFCLIIGSSYSGGLKAHLTTPTYTKPIESLKEIDESGYHVGIVLAGGEEEEIMMETSKDPYMMSIWKKKEALQFTPYPNVKCYIFLGKQSHFNNKLYCSSPEFLKGR